MKYYYFHGFGSSPQAKKALIMKKILGEENVEAPDFNLASGKEVKSLLDGLVKNVRGAGDETFIVGSSLGGLYALYVSALARCGCLLLNPCLFPQLIISGLTSAVPVKDIVMAQQLSLTAYSGYCPEKVRVWVTKSDKLIDHDKLTRPFFYNPPAEYRKFSKDKAEGHEFKGFKSVFSKYF